MEAKGIGDSVSPTQADDRAMERDLLWSALFELVRAVGEDHVPHRDCPICKALRSATAVLNTGEGDCATCYGRQEHRWSEPIKSSLYRCTVKVCSRCDRVVKIR